MAEGAERPSIIPDQGDGVPGPGAFPVFVYGSLKHGQPNHHWLAGATPLGEGQLEGVQLFDLGPFPMAVAQPVATSPPGPCNPLQGELYQVDGPTLEQLDRLEGAPRLYQRHWLRLNDGRSAWVYLGQPAQVRRVAPIPSGLWTGPRDGRWWRSEPRR